MGVIKDVKVSTATDAARKAAGSGRKVLVYRQNVPWSKSGWSGEVGDMGEVIEAIEAQGWRLDHMSYDGQQSSNGGCLLLFRRERQPEQAPQPQADMRMPQPSPEWVQQHPYHPQQPGLGQLAREWPPR